MVKYQYSQELENQKVKLTGKNTNYWIAPEKVFFAFP